MGTPGSGRKRAPIKDRFSAEDEALSSIAREAEARLAAKRAARAEARDIRMRELERQQKEVSYHHSSSSSSRKWGQIHQWMVCCELDVFEHAWVFSTKLMNRFITSLLALVLKSRTTPSNCERVCAECVQCVFKLCCWGLWVLVYCLRVCVLFLVNAHFFPNTVL
uniref:Leucine-rich repeat flightless-interacting protein 2 n=1 Tax=Astyanax mexicanus TaxID=7994 RepID=A0A8B9RH15_ASTMX